MHPRRRIANLLRQKVLILDGAMGTELQKRGLPPGVCPEAWCLANPSAVAEIHAAYRSAGADMVYTATFGANRIKMGKYSLTNIRDTNRALAAIAKKAVGPTGLVAGDIGPSGRFVEPFGDLPFAEAVEVFREQAQGLLEGGVDCFVIETMMDIQEARAALIAVREISDLFTIVTMTYERHGRTLNGTDCAAALVTLQALGADAVGCNCSEGPETMVEIVTAMKPFAKVPLVAKPNAGLPKLVGDKTLFDMDAPAFAAFGKRFAEAGVNLMGGCCGTTPGHIAALGQALAAERPIAPLSRRGVVLSSARTAVTLGRDKPLAVIGSRLNTAENDALSRALQSGITTVVRQTAREQEKEGAVLLQVKAASPGLDEKDALWQMVHALSPTMRLPVMIDGDRIEAVEQAVRRYPGRPLIRVAGEGNAWAALLPLAARYGAIPVLGCRSEGGPTVGRQEIRRAIAEARRYGFAKDEIVIAISLPETLSDPHILRTAIELVSWCEKNGACLTLLDMTGMGQGLPERQWLQAAFLAQGHAAGLTLAIVNPAGKEPMHIRAAADLLRGNDPDAAAWRARFAGPPETADR